MGRNVEMNQLYTEKFTLHVLVSKTCKVVSFLPLCHGTVLTGEFGKSTKFVTSGHAGVDLGQNMGATECFP